MLYTHVSKTNSEIRYFRTELTKDILSICIKFERSNIAIKIKKNVIKFFNDTTVNQIVLLKPTVKLVSQVLINIL